MLYNTKIPELVDRMDTQTLRVHAPSTVLMICGGKIDVREHKPPSLREALSRLSAEPPFDKYSLILAEHLDAFFPRGDYRDVLNFENDFAQLAHLVVLFSESYGSAAELGAFVMVEEIARRMLVVIDDENFAIPSYIKLGPLRHLELTYGRVAVCVVPRKDINIPSIRNVGDVDAKALGAILEAAIRARLPGAREPRTFDGGRPGHVAKLAVGFIQHYGALTDVEIQLYLDALGIVVEIGRLRNLLLCAEFAEWIVREDRGTETYFVTRGGNEAISYKQKTAHSPMDRDRWRSDIAEHWKASEPIRFGSIQSAMEKYS